MKIWEPSCKVRLAGDRTWWRICIGNRQSPTTIEGDMAFAQQVYGLGRKADVVWGMLHLRKLAKRCQCYFTWLD